MILDKADRTADFGSHSKTGKDYQTWCPLCKSRRLYKDGLRYLSNGQSIQRFLCRDCGYRFSNPNHNNLSEQKIRPNEKSLSKSRSKPLKGQDSLYCNRQVCASAKETKNLNNATETKTVAGEIPKAEQDVKGKIIEFLWH